MDARTDHRPASERGAAAVEFAILLPLLILLVFGILDFGRYYSARITVTHAAREGARAFAIGEDYTAAASSSAPGASITPGPGATCTPGSPASVTASVAFDPIFLPIPTTISSTGVMRCGG
jgi:Flp pilus assembly protein TadG